MRVALTPAGVMSRKLPFATQPATLKLRSILPPPSSRDDDDRCTIAAEVSDLKLLDDLARRACGSWEPVAVVGEKSRS